jgi:hypothetical protein
VGDAGDVGIEAEQPLSVDQVVDALVAVKAGLLVDPDHRSDGPTEDDLPSLLAGLLAKVELETATRVRPLVHEGGAVETVAAYLAGWHDVVRAGETDPDALVMEVLANRMQRTVIDLDHATGGTPQTEGEEEDAGDQPIVARAAINALMAAGAFLEVLLHAADPAYDEHRGLDHAETFLALALMTLTGRRMELNSAAQPPDALG